MKKPVIFILAAALLLATIGCTGTMDGVIQQDAARFQITYTDSRIAVAELIAQLPSGERFQGKSERLDAKQEAMASDTAAGEDESAAFPALLTFPGNAKAVLLGNRGNKMACRFKLTDVIIGFSSGGFGVCQMSDGRVIDVFF
jgi:hypothetical protein